MPQPRMRRSLCFTAFILGLLIYFGAAATDALAGSPPANPAGSSAASAQVYVFRGIGGAQHVPAMDELTAKMRARGLNALIFDYINWLNPANDAIKRYKSESVKSPIIAVGYSAGGDSAIRFSLWLSLVHVPVDLVITVDPTRIANQLPGNIRRYINVYRSTNGWGGGDPTPAPGFHGYFSSVDLKNFSNLTHEQMPRIPGLQDEIVNKVALAAGGLTTSNDAKIRLDYVMPPAEPIELWDFGVQVVSDAGDTVATVAAQFHCPAWAVSAINKVDATKPLPAGQRLVVPRELSGAQAPK